MLNLLRSKFGLQKCNIHRDIYIDNNRLSHLAGSSMQNYIKFIININ